MTAEPVDVGRVAAENAIVLTDLRAGDEGGLEDLFLELTADTQRDDLPDGVSGMSAGHPRRLADPRASRSVRWSGSSCARWPTPAPGAGC